MIDGNNDSETPSPPEAMADALGSALGNDGGTGNANAMSRGNHGTVTGDDDVGFDLERCEIVAQTYDTEAGVGSRLYHVNGDTYALSQYRRSVSQEWAETLLTHGELTIQPATLDVSTFEAAVREYDASPLTDVQLTFIQNAYDTACKEAFWSGLEGARTNDGPVLRGELACIEDHGWRETLRSSLAERLDDCQVEAVLDNLMDARPDVDWTWCQLYAVYVIRMLFEQGNTVRNDGPDAV